MEKTVQRKNENDYPMTLTAYEVCEILRVSYPTVMRWFNEGKIPSLPVGSVKRVGRDEFFNWFRESQKRRDY